MSKLRITFLSVLIYRLFHIVPSLFQAVVIFKLSFTWSIGYWNGICWIQHIQRHIYIHHLLVKWSLCLFEFGGKLTRSVWMFLTHTYIYIYTYIYTDTMDIITVGSLIYLRHYLFCLDWSIITAKVDFSVRYLTGNEQHFNWRVHDVTFIFHSCIGICICIRTFANYRLQTMWFVLWLLLP